MYLLSKISVYTRAKYSNTCGITSLKDWDDIQLSIFYYFCTQFPVNLPDYVPLTLTI